MSDAILPDDEADDPSTRAPAATSILVPRKTLEQIYVHLVSVYDSYQTRKLRQAIMILEHLLEIRR